MMIHFIGFTLLTVFILENAFCDGAPRRFRRCVSDEAILENEATSPFALFQSSCEAEGTKGAETLIPSKKSRISSKDRHIAIIVPPWVEPISTKNHMVLHPIVSLAAKLEGFNVSILQIRDPTQPHRNSTRLLNRIRLHGESSASNLLQLRHLTLSLPAAESVVASFDHDGKSPTLQAHFAVDNSLMEFFESDMWSLPDMMILDSTNIGALFAAERMQIPTTVIVSSHESSSDLSNLLSTELTHRGSHSIWLWWRTWVFRKRLALSWSWRLPKFNGRLNQRHYRFPISIRKPIDLMRKFPLLVLIPRQPWMAHASSKGNSQSSLPLHVRMVRPLWTSCVPCHQKSATKALSAGQNVTVLISSSLTKDDKATESQSNLLILRAIIRGIAIARGALQAKGEVACQESSSITTTTTTITISGRGGDCHLYTFFSHLKVVVWKSPTRPTSSDSEKERPGLDDLLLPSFVHVETTSHLLDFIARHPLTFVMISECDTSIDSAHTMATNLGITTLCIPREKLSKRDTGSFISQRILRHMEDTPTSLSRILRNPIDATEVATILQTVLLQVSFNKNPRPPDLKVASDEILEHMKLIRRAKWRDKSLRHIRKYVANHTIKKARKNGGTNRGNKNEAQMSLWLFPDIALEPLLGDNWSWWITYFASNIILFGFAYVYLFWENVKSPHQIPSWRRRWKWVTYYTSAEIDPALLKLQKWWNETANEFRERRRQEDNVAGRNTNTSRYQDGNDNRGSRDGDVANGQHSHPSRRRKQARRR